MIGGGIVVEAFGPLLEQRGDDDHAQLLGQGGEPLGAGPGNRLGQIEEAMVLDLAEVLAPEELLEADDLRAAGGRLAHAVERGAHIGLGVVAAADLHQTEGDLIVGRACHGSENNGRSGATPCRGRDRRHDGRRRADDDFGDRERPADDGPTPGRGRTMTRTLSATLTAVVLLAACGGERRGDSATRSADSAARPRRRRGGRGRPTPRHRGADTAASGRAPTDTGAKRPRRGKTAKQASPPRRRQATGRQPRRQARPSGTRPGRQAEQDTSKTAAPRRRRRRVDHDRQRGGRRSRCATPTIRPPRTRWTRRPTTGGSSST